MPKRPRMATRITWTDSVEATHDVLVVGAGCAGMRAAIEAHDLGADVALLSKIHPSAAIGAAEGGINAALGEFVRGQSRGARLRHRQGLRLPGRPGRDRDPLRRGARRRLPARALGSDLLPTEDGRMKTLRRRGRCGPPTRRLREELDRRVAPSEVACMCAKSSTGRTQSTCSASQMTSSRVPRSRTRPITSTPNGTARPLPSRRSRSEPSWSATASSAASRFRPSRKPGWKTTSSAPHATATPAEWSSIPVAMLYFLSRSRWPMKPAIGA